jgi:hypothetical protein
MTVAEVYPGVWISSPEPLAVEPILAVTTAREDEDDMTTAMFRDADDDRIVLPLEKVRLAARALCNAKCPVDDGGRRRHRMFCLVPNLESRDEMVRRVNDVLGVTPDCRDGAHAACTGCTCRCHNP